MHITRAGRQTSMPQSSTHLLISEFLCSPLEKERPLFLFFLPPQNNHTKISKLHALEIHNMPCKNLARGISCIRLWLMWQKPQNHLQRQKKLTHLPSHFPSLTELWLEDNLAHILHQSFVICHTLHITLIVPNISRRICSTTQKP